MGIALIATTEEERGRFAEAVGELPRVQLIRLAPHLADAALNRASTRVAVVEHLREQFDGLALGRDLLRCRPDLHVVLVATGGDETLAVRAIKDGLADYLPRERLAELGRVVRALLGERPPLSAAQAARDRESLLELALRAAELGAWEWDLLSGDVRSLNLEGVFGVPAGTCNGSLESYVGLIHPTDRARFLAHGQAILAGTDSFPMECRSLRPDGGVRWVYVTGRVERVGTRAVSARGVVMDVTDARCRDARRQRAQQLESLGLAIGSIAHDLSNAMTPIQLAVDLLRASPDAGRSPSLLDTMATSVERGVAMLRRVLELARGQETVHDGVDLAELLASLEVALRQTLPAGIALHLRVAAGLPPIRGDAEQLTRALQALAANAIDAMPTGGRLDIEASPVQLAEADARVLPGARPGGYVLVRVTDTGEGIAQSHLDRIFEPFFTTRAAQGHAGLGLSIVRGTVRRHLGALEIGSQPGQGTVIRLWFPCSRHEGKGQADGPHPDGR